MRVVFGCLARDEEANLEDLFSSLDLIPVEAFVLGDDGSKDKTVPLCQQYAEKRRIPFYKIDTELRDHGDFAKARNLVLHAARQFIQILSGKDMNDWFLLSLDCDDRLLKCTLEWGSMNCSYEVLGSVTLRNGRIRYPSDRMVKLDSDVEWTSPVHETTISSKRAMLSPERFLVQSNSKGYRNSIGIQVFLSDAEKLLRHFPESFDQARTLFLIASSFENYGDWRKALYYYRIRSVWKGGSLEEKYLSLLKIAELTRDTSSGYFESFEKFVSEQLLPIFEAINLFPDRIEGWTLLAYFAVASGSPFLRSICLGKKQFVLDFQAIENLESQKIWDLLLSKLREYH
ncbi:hypothetical protein Gasu2_33650 [Galdieria sulphuraria]|nr:hypothetical protein Gasu2_33650 [Galdieria sulphuraria]